MVNSVSMPPSPVPQTKISGKTHCRNSELISYRSTIETANSKMIEAADRGDIETANFWSGVIDKTQEKISSIIKQEDTRSSEKASENVATIKTAADGLDKLANSAVKLTGAVASTKLNLVA